VPRPRQAARTLVRIAALVNHQLVDPANAPIISDYLDLPPDTHGTVPRGRVSGRLLPIQPA